MSVRSKPSPTVHAAGSKVSLTLCSLTSARICRMTSPLVPDLAEMLDTLSVVQIPMRVRFRGVTVREAALIRGPEGWGEFAPFPEYGDCLLYTSDAADDLLCVDLGGRRIIKKKKL